MPNLTSNYSLQKPLVNDPTDEDLWGDEINKDTDDIDALLKQGITITPQSSQTMGFVATSSIRVKYLYPCDATSGAFAATLPTAVSAGSGSTIFFKKTDVTTNAITVTRASSDTIDGANTFVLNTQYSVLGLISDGVSKWNIILKTDSVFTGDSGSGGTMGLVPAPASGDAAAGKVLKASGSWGIPIFSKEYISTGQVLTPGGLLTLAHGLGSIPKVKGFYVKCINAGGDNGYVLNDMVELSPAADPTSNNRAFSCYFDSTNINIRYGATSPGVTNFPNKATGASGGVDPSKWNFYVQAYA